MNKDTYIKYKKELDAWAEGKEVEFKFTDANLWVSMSDHTPPELHCDIELRMKPESPEPKYRPFSESDPLIKLLDDCVVAISSHRDKKWSVSKIMHVNGKGIIIGDGSAYTFKEALDCLLLWSQEIQDYVPFGVKILTPEQQNVNRARELLRRKA